TPGAIFLKKYGNELGDLKHPESLNFSGCEDVPCIINRIYKKENHVAGYVHYIWFLKFKHLLAADNLVPSLDKKKTLLPGIYNERHHNLDDYLYSDNELYALWRLSSMLNDHFYGLKDLNEVQRIPRGNHIEGKGESSCGLAFTRGNIGKILLTDGCLELDKD